MAETKKKYARGKNPNSRKGDANLIDIRTQTAEKQREFHSLGGKSSQATQAENRNIRKIIEIAIQKSYKNEETGAEEYPLVAGIAKIVDRFRKTGNINDLEALSEHLGQKPAQKVEQVVITPEVDFDKLESLRKALRKDD
jgi:hypothetical protein